MRIAITGIGSILPCGADAGEAGRALAEGRCRWQTLPGDDVHRLGAATAAGLVDDAALAPWLHPLKARRMGRPSRLAVAAAQMAVADAGIGDEAFDAVGVVLATSYGPASFTERLLQQVFLEEPTAASPALFTESVANAPAAQIALTLGARGPNVTVTQREAGPALALTQAARMLRTGRARRVLVGAVDEVSPVLHAVLDRFGVLATGTDPRPAPYHPQRRGFVLSEGVTVLVLEPVHDARPVHAWFAFGGAAFDARARPTGYPPDGRVLAQALERSLSTAGWEKQDVDAVVTGASGSLDGDRADARLVCALFGEGRTVVAPKAVAGECGAAPLLAAVQVAAGLPPPRCPPIDVSESDLGVLPYTEGGWNPPERTLCVTLAVGGSCAWFGLEKGNVVDRDRE